MSIYFLIGRIYFNQLEQSSTAVNSGGGGLFKNIFCVNEKHDRLSKIYTKSSGHVTKMATTPICIKTFLNPSTPEPEGQRPWGLVSSIMEESPTQFAQMLILG